MKNRLYSILTLIVALSMFLSACGGAAATTVAPVVTQAPVVTTPEAVVVPTDTPVPPEPTAVPITPATDEQVDSAYTTLLTTMKGYNSLKMDAFAEMLAADPKPFLLDVREMSEVEEKGYIEGAVLIPLRELGANLDKLPSFDTTIVSYCGSGWRCTIAMTALTAMGWENVLALKDNSFGGWAEKGNPVVAGLPAEAAVIDAAVVDPSLELTFSNMFSAIPEGWGAVTAEKLNTNLVENADLIVIDVRKTTEIEENGYIEAANALAIPIEEFIAQRANWPADKNASIAVYCGSGHRSTMAMTMLWTYGYTNVTSLKGGFAGWKDAGYAVAGAPPDLYALLDEAYTNFLANMVKYNTMSLDELNVALGEEPAPYLLDVRETSEVEEKGHIENATLIPLRELGVNLDKLPSFDTAIVSYCGSGWRCTIAMTAMGAMGWENVLALKGNSYGGWVDAGYPTVAGLPAQAAVLNTAVVEPVLAEHFAKVFAAIPEGWGALTTADLNVELTENADLIVIDVRTAAERAEKGIIGAANEINIPLEEFIAQKANWPADLNAKIVVYCGSGHRSTMAMTILWSYGYTNVRSMKGGLAAWVEAALPVATVTP